MANRAKARYALRVSRSGKPIGEYVFNATPNGLRQLIERMKPEFQFDILGHDRIVYASEADHSAPARPAVRGLALEVIRR